MTAMLMQLTCHMHLDSFNSTSIIIIFQNVKILKLDRRGSNDTTNFGDRYFISKKTRAIFFSQLFDLQRQLSEASRFLISLGYNGNSWR